MVAAPELAGAAEDESQFRIEATGALREPRTRILKHGETFAVLNQFGDMVGEPGSPDGLYHQDTRFLSQLELRLNGDRPLLLSSNPAEDGSVLPVDLANTDTIAADGSELHRELIYVNRRQFIWRVGLLRAAANPQFRPAPLSSDVERAFRRGFRRCLRSARGEAGATGQMLCRAAFGRDGRAAL